ncbi:MAG: PKD domain-containing protein, partial [Bacteroidetes bacterium]|nr:PKD domain-containing protein [Bacteroidota bacterium]
MDSVGNPNSSNTEDDIQTNGWTQISTGFQNTNNWSSIYPIPFTFKFFNDTVTNFKVSYNGLLTFDTNAVKLPNLNINLPDTSLPNQTIMCFWDEFTDDPPTGSNDVSWIKTFGTSPNRQFWIKWFSFEYGNPNTSYSFFAIVLEETSNKIYLIDMQLAASSVSSTIGLQLNDSTAVQFGSNNIDFGSGSQILEDNDYYEFIPFINVSPQASFKISDTLSCTGIISFTDLSLYSPTSWHWDFGDGDTSINQNPVHIYATSDTFTVILTATNGNGTDTIIKSDLIIVDISSPPSAPACTPTTSNYCCGYGINNVILNTINHSSGDGKDGYQDYSCYVNTNVYAGGLYNLSVLIDSPLLHNVRAWIDFNNDNSFNDVTELVFDYQDVYDASGSIYISTSAIRDTFLRLRISAETNLLPAPNSCTNLTSGQVEDYGIKILDNPNPPSVNFIVDDTLTCDGVVNFTDSTLNDPKTWFWDFGDSNTDTVQNPSHVYASSGYYNVKLVVTNSNGSDSITKNSFIKVTIGNDPITPSCMPSTQSYCCGYGITNLLFDSINNTSLDAAEGYQDFSCAYQTTIQEGKQYPISITTGSSAHDTRVWIDFDNDGVFIDSTEMVFEALNAASPSGTIYIPSVQNKLIPLRLRISTDNAGGNISSCTNPFRGQVEDYTVFVDSNPDPPQPNFIASDSTSCDGIISFNDFSLNLPDSWYWDFGDFTFDTIQNPLHTYNQPGIYTVKLIVSNKNGIDSLVKTNYINVL